MLKKYLHNVADIYIDDCVPSLDDNLEFFIKNLVNYFLVKYIYEVILL